MKILLVEDDASVAAYVKQGLEQLGHSVDWYDNGSEALAPALEQSFDIAIVDRMLPGIDGLTFVRSLRGAQVTMPVVFLTALGDVDQRVAGLKAGADDYLCKPFSLQELAARLEALGRRIQPTAAQSELTVADLSINLLNHKVTRAGQEISLQPREFRLLTYLVQHQDQVVTRTMLLEKVWDYHFDPATSIIDVHVSRLRQKVDKGFQQQLIHTVRGVGYVVRGA